jgi:uncharacterized protein YukE
MTTTKMRDLTSADVETWALYQGELRGLFDAVATATAELTGTISDFNMKVEEAQGFVNEIADEAENEFNERSQKWQEGEAGQEYQAWCEQIRDFASQLEPIDEIDEPEEPTWLDEDLPERS